MMLQDKLISGQFLLDFKNEHSGLLQTSAGVHQQPSSSLHLHSHSHLQSPSPPFAALDIYSAYAYQQQQLQQKLLNTTPVTNTNVLNQSVASSSSTNNIGEVLDLSRRGDLMVETTTTTTTTPHESRKTPSPLSFQNNSTQYRMDTPPSDSSNTADKLLYKPVPQTNTNTHTDAIHHENTSNHLLSIYPKLSYTNSTKLESIALTPPPPPSILTTTNPIIAPKLATNSGLLQTFATAAANLKADDSIMIQQNHLSSTLCNSNGAPVSLSTLDNSKNTRPFKAYPRDPLVVAANFAATDILLDNPRVERYTEYRKRVLEHIRRSNGGSRTISNPKMRRTNSRSFSLTEDTLSNTSESEDRSVNMEDMSDCDSNSGGIKTNDITNADISSSKTQLNNATNTNNSVNSTTLVKDAAYYERRRKNNAAAKKSRDRRRLKEDEIAMRAAFLEHQNVQLKAQIVALQEQLAPRLARSPPRMPLDV
uniref:BZIP domain-containing protein n=1 Tax=Glossina brevipalpis TaxID=37001 RepID=A0A1A9WLD7_9MUSC